MRLRIGVDVGGTFTDLAATDLDTGRSYTRKTASTPDHPETAILTGTSDLLKDAGATGRDVVFFGHGTTVVTNMVVERKGARLAVVTTEGFRDVLELGRQARPNVYDYRIRRPEPLAKRRDRFEVRERTAANGQILTDIDRQGLQQLAVQLRKQGAEAVAICFLHAYANPKNEIAAVDILKAELPDIFVTASHRVASEYREFERFSTTAVNAFVGPRAGHYFGNLEAGLRKLGIKCPLYTITSNSGLIDVASASALPVRTALSGPAAGVTGISRLLSRHDFGDLVTFDVGGTSTDIALIERGKPKQVRARNVAGYPVLAPMVDIEVIGAGGGSLARIDEGGALAVGPQSAGAVPGPVAYGRGGDTPTVTDAALVLGWLDADMTLGNSLTFDLTAAQTAIQRQIAEPLGLERDEAASGILAIATANMARTIRSVASARGFEPEKLSLVAYGGAGPLLAVDVAVALGMTRVVVPTVPGTLCARSVLVSDIARDYSHTIITPLSTETWKDLCDSFRTMEIEGTNWLSGEDIDPSKHAFEQIVEARYAGQNFEIAIPFDAESNASDLRRLFDATHDREQGYALPDRAVEIVTLRLKASARIESAQMEEPETAAKMPDTDTAPLARRSVSFFGQRHETPIYDRDLLRIGQILGGPAIVQEYTATTVIPPGWSAECLDDATLVITPSPAEAE